MKRTILPALACIAFCFIVILGIAFITDAVGKVVGATPIYGRPIRPPALLPDGTVPTPGNDPVPYAHPPFPTNTATPTPTGSPPISTNTPTRTPTPTRTMTPGPTATCGPGWGIVPSPNIGPGGSTLSAVDGLSASDAWVVGSYIATGAQFHTLIEHWDGSQWVVVPGANPGSNMNFLLSVDARSPDDVWAVGYHNTGTISQTQTTIQRWDGAQWSLYLAPNPGLISNVLYSVSALSPDDVWAVGVQADSVGAYRTLTEHWDGTGWSVVPSPNVGTAPNYLWSVAAVSTNDVWAAGSYGSQTLILHWDGVQWSIVPSPNGPGGNVLFGMSAVSTGDVWAVGSANAPGPYQTLIEHWDGVQWSIVPSPNNGSSNLYSVTVASSSDVWAAGYYGNSATLIEHWDGAQWSIVQSPSPGYSSLVGIAAVSATEVWAVGNIQNTYTLVERHRGCTDSNPSPTPTGTRWVGSSPTPTVPGTYTPVATQSPPATGSPIATGTGAAETGTPIATETPGVTATPCSISFSDVQSADYFYDAVRHLYCLGAISGYSDGSFRPYNDTTRGQLCKIVTLAEGWAIDTIGGPHFSDVPESNPFYPYIETAYNHTVITGYSDGTFRWGNNITRAQLAKIVVSAEQWTLNTSGGPHFSDVPTGDPFYGYVETAYHHNVVSGYSDGTFRPGNPATRGQIAKIVFNAITGAGG